MNEYSDRIKCFYEFLHKKSGKIRLMIDNYLLNFPSRYFRIKPE